MTTPLIGLARDPVREAARKAWIYGLPLIEMANSRSSFLTRSPANRLAHARRLVTPKTQRVTTSNVDTLYTAAWLDLSAGPVTLRLPDAGERYVSAALLDMFTNNIVVLGTRTTGREGQRVTIAGPQHAVDRADVIRSPTNWAWLLIRVLVDGDADMARAHAVQDGFELHAPIATARPVAGVARDASPEEYFAAVAALLRESPPPATDRRLLQEIIPLGLQGGPSGSTDAAAVAAGIADAQAVLRNAGKLYKPIAGWQYPKPNLGMYGQDYDYRAMYAVSGLGALPREEAMYLWAIASDGGLAFDGSKPWRLRLGNDLPVDAFWSLTAYLMKPDGEALLADNPIDRYAIGDRTPGLMRRPDGSVELLITHNEPEVGARNNWLPIARDAPFGLVFRAYLPGMALLDGQYRLPALTQV